MRLLHRKSNSTTPPPQKFDLVGLIFALGFLGHAVAPILHEIGNMAN